MTRWYEVYDNEEVQRVTRIYAARWRILAAALVFIGSVVLYDHLVRTPYPTSYVLTILATCALFSLITLRKIHRLHEVVWCIKLSDRHIVGYDYSRQKLVLDWTNISSLDCRRDGIHLLGDHALHIPQLYPDYATLSHRILDYAELYEIPITIDGAPWQMVDLYTIYPFLHDTLDPLHESGEDLP